MALLYYIFTSLNPSTRSAFDSREEFDRVECSGQPVVQRRFTVCLLIFVFTVLGNNKSRPFCPSSNISITSGHERATHTCL